MTGTRGLYATLAASVAVAIALALLLVHPASRLQPLRATTFELDEPPVPPRKP